MSVFVKIVSCDSARTLLSWIIFLSSQPLVSEIVKFIIYLKEKDMAKEKEPKEKSSKKAPVLSLKEKRAAKEAKRKEKSSD